MFWIADEKSGFEYMDGAWPEENEAVAGMWLVTAAQEEDKYADSWQITVGKGKEEKKKMENGGVQALDDRGGV